jgi:hypothetical protein
MGFIMAWDWEKLQQLKKSGGGGAPPQVGDVLDRIKGMKGKFPGIWIIIIVIILIYFGSSTFYTIGVYSAIWQIYNPPQDPRSSF